MNGTAAGADGGAALESMRARLQGVPTEGGEVLWRFSAAGVVPRCVARPSTVDGVVRAVQAGREGGLALIPCGNATHLDVGRPPRQYDVALSTHALDEILAHEDRDLTVTAQAGVTVDTLNRALARAGQWLPLDPAAAGEMTLGGLIAADRSGPQRFAYGKVRESLIGLQVVMADGSLLRGGGRVVKNVAGYDLPKLFTGSYGTLGVIVEATFKVRPLPAAEALFVWPQPSVGAAVERALALCQSPVSPVLLEAVNDAAAETLGLDAGAALVVGCAGSATELEEEERRLAACSDAAVRRCPAPGAEPLRRALRDFSQPASEEAVVARISALPTHLPGLLTRIETEAAARAVMVEIAAHAGSGVAWCELLGKADAQALALFAEWMRLSTREHGGWLVFEALPPALRGQIDPWGFNEGSVPLMAGIKRALDPAAIFSPGRFVGGI